MSDKILKIEPNPVDSLEIAQGNGVMSVTVAWQWDQSCIDLTIEEARTLAMWILNKTGGVAEPVPPGAKLCSKCDSHRLVSFRTIQHEDFDKPGYRHCADCGHNMPWHLDEGQPALLGSHRSVSRLTIRRETAAPDLQLVR